MTDDTGIRSEKGNNLEYVLEPVGIIHSPFAESYGTPTRLLSVEGTVLKDIDKTDSTPLIDMKPFVPSFDVYTVVSTEWIRSKDTRSGNADDRFE